MTPPPSSGRIAAALVPLVPLAPLVVLVALVASGCPPAAAPPPSVGFRAVTFPDGFIWGTATAGWQIEGDEGVNGPVDSNWSRWMAIGEGKGEQQNVRGNGFFTGYADDVQRARDLGLTHFRMSIDWSRIEPQPGVFDEDEMQHVIDVLDAVRAAQMEPVVTLWHWTVPTWVQNPDDDAPGGALDRIRTKDDAVVDDFEGFVRFVVPRIADRVDMYTVLNEPLTMVVVGYIDGTFPPGGFLDIEGATDFGINLARMHARAFDVIEELDGDDVDGDGAPSFVGLTMTANDIYPERADSEQERFAAASLNYVYNDWFLHAVIDGALDVNLDGTIDPSADTDPPEGQYTELAGRLEFIGVQYYGPTLVKELALLTNLPPLYGLPILDVDDYTSPEDQKRPHNGMGREIQASGFADTLDRYAAWGLPLIITENGTTTNARPPEIEEGETELPTLVFDDEQAAMYLTVHLWELGRAINDRDIDVRGYFHWTLADNYEWVEGKLQRFGAYTVDFDDPSMPRTLNTMGEALRDVAGARGIDQALFDKYVRTRFPTDTTTAGVGTTTREPQVGPLE